MEHTTRGFAAIVQLLSEPPSPPVHDKPAAWPFRPPSIHQPPVHKRTAEIVCPLPVRPVRAPCLVDNANGMVRCSWPHKGFNRDTFQQAEMELLDFILGQDGDGFDTNGDGTAGFFLGTPPARTGNPIVNDAEFRKQSLAAVAAANASPRKPYYHPTAPPSPRGERASNGPSPSSFTGVPSIRVEGFPSSRSDPHPRRRVVSALA